MARRDVEALQRCKPHRRLEELAAQVEMVLTQGGEGRLAQLVYDDGGVVGTVSLLASTAHVVPVTDRSYRLCCSESREVVGQIDDLFVDPRWWNRGVGRALVASAMAVAWEWGFQRVVAHSTNPAAVAAFVAGGLREWGRLPDRGDGEEVHLYADRGLA